MPIRVLRHMCTRDGTLLKRRTIRKVMMVFGTRPEAIKCSPVIREMSARPDFDVINVVSSQHTDLLHPLIDLFGISVAADLDVMRPNQQPNDVLSRVVSQLDAALARFAPDFVLVQGDTTTALAGALAAFHRRIPLGHIEAGLRSGNPDSPFPEEMNRRLISQIAALHFVATTANRNNLLREGIDPGRIALTGNPVVDALRAIRGRAPMSPALREVLARSEGKKRIVLTAHRRESFGETMRGYFDVLNRFVAGAGDRALLFPVHPNPAVRAVAEQVFGSAPNVFLLEPLDYPDFVHLLSSAWLVVSDSGGVQEEAPSLGKPLLVLRRDTERQEAIDAGVSRLVPSAGALANELAEIARPGSWIDAVHAIENPFGDGHAATRIADCIAGYPLPRSGSRSPAESIAYLQASDSFPQTPAVADNPDAGQLQ
jgi:UDP-N-acetylglucosamine 2-epimerase (non-hydrolysing)